MNSPFAEVRAIYFDLDDTLCAYWDASKAGLRRAFEMHGPEGYDVEDLLSHWAITFREFAPGLKSSGWFETYLKTAEPTRTEQMRRTLARLNLDDHELAARLSEAYLRERDTHLALFPDAVSVLEALSKRYPLGLITNGPADLQRMEIATLKVEKYFPRIFIEGELEYGKPHETPFRLAREAVGLSPSELLMVGNSYGHDIRPAIEFGWKTAWIRRASDVPPSLRGETLLPEERPHDAPEPTVEIHELSELLDLLNV